MCIDFWSMSDSYVLVPCLWFYSLNSLSSDSWNAGKWGCTVAVWDQDTNHLALPGKKELFWDSSVHIRTVHHRAASLHWTTVCLEFDYQQSCLTWPFCASTVLLQNVSTSCGHTQVLMYAHALVRSRLTEDGLLVSDVEVGQNFAKNVSWSAPSWRAGYGRFSWPQEMANKNDQKQIQFRSMLIMKYEPLRACSFLMLSTILS